MEIKAILDKGEVYKINQNEQVIIADTGNLDNSCLENLTDTDEIFKKSISEGYVDHHVADTLPIIQGKDIRNCSTQMVVSYYEDVLKYINEHNVKEVYIHRDTDLDAICSGWMIKYLGENQKLPEIAKEMAYIVNKVDYAIYRTKKPEDYAYSFPGCISAIMGSIKSEKRNILKNDTNNLETQDKLKKSVLDIIEKETNDIIVSVLDVIEKEKKKNPEFDIGMTRFDKFLENNSEISPYIKAHLKFGVNRMLKDQDDFIESLKSSETLEFTHFNCEKKCNEKGKILIVDSWNPLKTTNVAYNNFTDRIIAAYNPKKGWFAIGIAAESLKGFRPLMKQLCIALNRVEEKKRLALYNKENKTPEDVAMIEKIESYAPVEAFNGASKLKLIDKAPVPLVGGGSLIIQSYCCLIEDFDEFKNILRNFAKNTKSLNFDKNNCFEK